MTTYVLDTDVSGSLATADFGEIAFELSAGSYDAADLGAQFPDTEDGLAKGAAVLASLHGAGLARLVDDQGDEVPAALPADRLGAQLEDAVEAEAPVEDVVPTDPPVDPPTGDPVEVVDDGTPDPVDAPVDGTTDPAAGKRGRRSQES